MVHIRFILLNNLKFDFLNFLLLLDWQTVLMTIDYK